MSINNENYKVIEEQFADDCKVINLKYEYPGYTGDVKWAIISNLTEEEIVAKYFPLIKENMPFIVLSLDYGKERDTYHKNEKKHYMRAARGSCFSIDDEFEEHHSESAVSDYVDEVLFSEQRKRLWEAINSLDEKQRNRLISYFIDGKTYRDIGKLEGVDHKAIIRSVESALKKLKKFLK